MKTSFLTIFFLPTFLYAQHLISFQEAEIPKPKQLDLSVSTFNQNQKFFSLLNTFEKDFYYWVNYSRNNPSRFFDSVIVPISKIYPQLQGDNFKSLKKDLKSTSSLPLLSLDNIISSMAKSHSVDITSHNLTPSHNSTNGNSFVDRFKQYKLKNCGAENISYGSGEAIFLLALLYLDIDIPELGHRKTLLNPNFVNTGLGSSKYKNGSIFLVEDFACSQD